MALCVAHNNTATGIRTPGLLDLYYFFLQAGDRKCFGLQINRGSLTPVVAQDVKRHPYVCFEA